MTSRLRLTYGNAVLILENDNMHLISDFADYCKSIGAYSSTGEPLELNIDNPDESVIEKVHSKAFELNLI